MTTLIVIVSIMGWLIGFYLTARQYALNELERKAQFHAGLHGLYPEGTPLIDNDDRSMAWSEALAVCWAFWPAVLLIYGLRRIVRLKPLVPPTERARLERQELKQLRQQARKYGLPMGDERKEGR